MLCLNVSAGIGVIGMASPTLQEIFGGKLIGAASVGFTQLCRKPAVTTYRTLPRMPMMAACGIKISRRRSCEYQRTRAAGYRRASAAQRQPR
jgi:hypothetical protein